MKGFFIGLSKLILGIAVALILLSMAGVATARYFMGRLSVLPPKPLYGDEMPTAAQVEPEAAPEAIPAAPEPVAEAPAAPEPELEDGAYNAVVVQPIGLVMREGPGVNYPQVGGVDVNEAVVVLEEPDDQAWVKVRVVSNGQEGWVKAGNTRRTE
ncbi:SH3 domain-containing protein [Leptolyngbya sp. KIOST-1]|uniref:SH3 domain-containing protein n=1 Tax=Leptolyngbya sp. KIOST-1 TaxID=1229172 RepID=UPI000567307F|nr:SH3 domain-containing protein [Leptolyngbya sp. KIOST-1]